MQLKLSHGAVIILAFFIVITAGCLLSPPGNQIPAQPPSTGTSPTSQAVTTPVTAVTTLPVTPPFPVETPVPVPAYVKRPFGYVQYTYNPDHEVKLQESHAETDPSGPRTITGTIKNTGPERIDLVTVTVNLYNSYGNLIGSKVDDVNYLDPGEIWKFRTEPFSNKDYAFYEIAEIFTG